jgi:hypothetical protein
MGSLNGVAHDDWRVSATFEEEGGGLHLLRRLPEMRFADEVRERLGGRLSVSREGPTVFVYADAEGPVREAERVVREELAEAGREAHIEVSRWHPVERRWEDASVPVPAAGAALEAEERVREAEDAADSVRQDAPEWEVRLELADEEAAARLADQLEAEGVAVTRHHRYLLAGAVNQEDAEALAARLSDEAPEGSQVHVEPGGLMAWETRPPNPFAIFGGFGG